MKYTFLPPDSTQRENPQKRVGIKTGLLDLFENTPLGERPN